MSFIRSLFRKVKSRDWKEIVHELRWAGHYVRRYWFQIACYSLLGVFATVLGLLGSLVSRNLIDAVTGFNHDSIAAAAGIYVGFGIGRIFIQIATGKMSLLVESKIANEIRSDIFDQILYTDWESIADYTTGDLQMRIGGDTGTISSSVLSLIPNALNTLVNFLGAFFILLTNDPMMALLSLIGAPVILLTGQFRLHRSKAFQLESRQMAGERMTFHNETLQNIQTIKAFGLLPQFSQKLKDLQAKALDLSLREYRYQSWTNILLSLTTLLVGYACYGFAVYRLWQGSISYGTMTLFLSMAASLSGSFSGLVNIVPTVIRTATSAGRVMEIVEMPRESYEEEPAAQELLAAASEKGCTVRMDHFSFHYKNGKQVFTDSSLTAGPGEITALVGPSGQGKTTALRLMLGLLFPQKGNLYVESSEGVTLRVSPSSRRLFCYVPQGNTMFYGTIAENLRMVKPEASDEELTEALKTACAWEFVSQLPGQLEAMVGQRGQGLSEGQSQRLSIARAILADAPVMLLDEATSALDVATERRVLRNILQAEGKKNIIVTTHRPTVLEACTRVYYIADQTIVPADQQKINEMIQDF